MEDEARALIKEMGLQEVSVHVYTPSVSDSTTVYIFKDYHEFNHYFLDNFIYLPPNQKKMAIIKEFPDGTILASKWICDRLIHNKKKQNDPLSTVEKSCGTCEYSYKESDLAKDVSSYGDSFYDENEPQLGSCCIGKTPEEQQASKYLCENYKPDYEVMEKNYKVITLSNKKRKR